MKRFGVVLVLSLALVAMGCAEEQGTSNASTQSDNGNVPYNPGGNPGNVIVDSPVPGNTTEGKDGGPCYSNNTCDEGIDCVDGTCKAKTAGASGGPCYGNGTCDEGLTCDENICKAPGDLPVGSAGGLCYGNQTCDDPNECIDGVCVGPQCLENECTTDIDCASCSGAKNTCLVGEKRCAECDPKNNLTSKQNPDCEKENETCNTNGVCETFVAKPCPTTEDGTPTIACEKNSDCEGCSPMHQICDQKDKRCKACSSTNTTQCLNTDICVDGECKSKCPSQCTSDGDCSQCVVKDVEAKACFAHRCAQCSDTYPCPAAENCINGVCVPACGLAGPIAGTCEKDQDCLFCGGNENGVESSASWKCQKTTPINGPEPKLGKCGPPVSGCSEVGQGVIVLPDPWNDYTQTCSNNNDCAGIAINYNVGKLLRDLVGDKVLGVEIEDALVQYEMNVCAALEVTDDVDCGICVPCAKDSDCNPIDLDPILFQLLGDNFLAQVAVQFLIQQLFPEENSAHNLYFFCEPVTAGYGACSPCSNPTVPCSKSGTSSSGSGGQSGELPTTDACDHSVCEQGGPLGANCGDCATAVCELDAFCCETKWDEICVSLVEEACTLSCGVGSEVSGEGSQPVNTCHSPCIEGDALNPDCGECATAVCEQDPFCCNNLWDEICVEIAVSNAACDCAGAGGEGSQGTTTGGGSSGGESSGTSGSCEGSCDGVADDLSCWCDDLCIVNGDCCADRCDFCPGQEGCQGESEGEEFLCNNGESIPLSWVCDGFDDCNSSEDEETCYECSDGDVLPQSSQCDGIEDCDEGEDEEGCFP